MIIIEGNIGVGKTTLLRNVKEYFKTEQRIRIAEEYFEDNIFLKNFYKNGSKDEAFKMQLKFLIDFYNNRKQLLDKYSPSDKLSNILNVDTMKKLGITRISTPVILHRSIFTIYYVFFKMHEFSEAEDELFKQIFDLLVDPIKHHYMNSIIYYIELDINENIKRLMKRNRDIEMKQNEDYWRNYLIKVSEYYNSYLSFMKEYFKSIIIISDDTTPEGFVAKIDKAVLGKHGRLIAYAK